MKLQASTFNTQGMFKIQASNLNTQRSLTIQTSSFLQLRWMQFEAWNLRLLWVLMLGIWCFASCALLAAEIQPISPPEKDFFTKRLDYCGIRIKAPAVVVDEALYAAYGRLSMLLSNQPTVVSNLVSAGAELHIIGRNQVTTDLPEWRHDKGVPRPEYKGKTRDERTRGMGGLLTSCGEENLLRLENDRYRGRDICIHEFSHNIRNHGVPREVRTKFNDLYHRSLEKSLWEQSYAASSPDEFFAELTMWYFGTHGDLHMTGTKPENGAEGLKKYDPEAFALLDEFYSGRMKVPIIERSPRVARKDSALPATSGGNSTN